MKTGYCKRSEQAGKHCCGHIIFQTFEMAKISGQKQGDPSETNGNGKIGDGLVRVVGQYIHDFIV